MIRNLIYNFGRRSFKNFENSLKEKNHLPSTNYKIYSTLTNLTKEEADDSREKMLKILHLEVDIARQEGRRVPDPALMSDSQWDHLLSLKSRSGRSKYYSYLWQIEKKREKHVEKKLIKAAEMAERKAILIEENEKNDHIIYGINHTTFLLRVYDTTINHWYNNRLINAVKFAPKIVLDCGYDSHMNRREATNTAKQLMLLFAENRFNDDPFDVHFCNVNFGQTVMKSLHKHIPTMSEPSFPLSLHENCFTDIFPKDKLVYLTPHCKNELVSYDSDDIYIVGAIVDKVNNEPLSLAKAKKLGVRMARLPLDRYLSWGAGSGKSLTLDQMINIMLDIKKTNDWNFALRHVPKRKLINYSQSRNEKKEMPVRTKKFEFNVSTWGEPKAIKNAGQNPFK